MAQNFINTAPSLFTSIIADCTITIGSLPLKQLHYWRSNRRQWFRSFHVKYWEFGAMLANCIMFVTLHNLSISSDGPATVLHTTYGHSTEALSTEEKRFWNRKAVTQVRCFKIVLFRGCWVDRCLPYWRNPPCLVAVADAVRTSLGPKGMDKMVGLQFVFRLTWSFIGDIYTFVMQVLVS